MTTRGAELPEKPKAKGLGIDRQDVLLVLGVFSLLAGIACWSRPLALVVFGAMCLGAVVLIERAKPAQAPKKETK